LTAKRSERVVRLAPDRLRAYVVSYMGVECLFSIPGFE
jgi:hypothetical protein